MEIRRAFRSLGRSLRFTTVSVATLAVGIGAATAIFTVVYAVLLKPLPFPEPDRVVHLWQVNEGGRGASFSDPNFEDIAERSRSFQALVQYRSMMVSVAGGGDAVRIRAATVADGFFDVVGMEPLIGRRFADEEKLPGGAPAAIVSYGFWMSYLGGQDLATLELRLEDERHPVVGVAPPELDFPSDASVWLAREREPRLPSRTAHNWRVIGRLEDGVSVEQAGLDVSAIARALRERFGDDTWMVDVRIVPLHEELTGEARPALLVLSGAVAFLLLVACANVVNLLLARAASRQKELAVSAALGASRWDLARPFLVESMILSLAGAALGVGLAAAGVRMLLSLGPAAVPRSDAISVGGPVLGFAIAVAVITALALGMTAAVRASRGALHDTLRERHVGHLGSRLRSLLVVSQVALTLVLLVGAGLLGRSLFRLLDVDPGFRTEGALVMDLAHPIPDSPDDKARLSALQWELIERIRAIPGVSRAGGIDRLPMATSNRNGMFLEVKPGEKVETFEDFGRLAQDESRVSEAEYRAATDGFFESMGIPLVRGRLFESTDGWDGTPVAVVSESLVEAHWGDADPIGALIEFGNMDGDLRLLHVIGIVGDVRHRGLDDNARPTLYVNARQRPPAAFTVVIESSAQAATVASASRIVRELAPEVPPRFRTMSAVVSSSYGERQFSLVLLGVFAVAALGLAVMGVYGIVAMSVSERTQELGVRIALGAKERDVLGLVVSTGLRLIAAGLVLGLLGAVTMSRFLGSLLFEISATDPATFAGIGVCLVAAALVACYVPARRAARTDPMVALRND